MGLREISLKLGKRERLQQDVIDEVRFLRLRHGAGALEAAHAELERGDLTPWGRLVAKGAAAELARRAPGTGEPRSWSPSRSYWRPPWDEDEGLDLN